MRLFLILTLVTLAACDAVGTAPQNQPYQTGSGINPDL
jgi:hypothetical protein